jgi:hypothetical protein
MDVAAPPRGVRPCAPDLAGDEPATTTNMSAGIGGSGLTGAGGAVGTAGVNGSNCPGTKCGSGQVCCVLNGACILPSRAAADCPKPTTLPAQSILGLAPCGSNADCAANEFCGSNTACLGPGQCIDRANCGTSTGPPICGCDGVTYKDVQTACRAGVDDPRSRPPRGLVVSWLSDVMVRRGMKGTEEGETVRKKALRGPWVTVQVRVTHWVSESAFSRVQPPSLTQRIQILSLLFCVPWHRLGTFRRAPVDRSRF